MIHTIGVGQRAFVLAAFLTACGTHAFESAPDATVVDASDDAPESGGAFPGDGAGGPEPLPWDAGLLDGGGPFLCFGCVCDGRTHYCDTSSGPGSPIPEDASACTDDAGWSPCTPLPDGCAPANCGCLVPNHFPCTCTRSDTGDGLNAGCVYP